MEVLSFVTDRTNLTAVTHVSLCLVSFYKLLTLGSPNPMEQGGKFQNDY